MMNVCLFSMQNRCVNMIAHLFNAPLGDSETAVGVGTVGSSEAIMLAGLAFKRKWQNKRRAEGKPCDKPNIVTGANVQVWWFIWNSLIKFQVTDHDVQEIIPDSVMFIRSWRFAGRNLRGTLRWSWRRWSLEMAIMWWIPKKQWKWWMRTQSVLQLFLVPLLMENLKMSSSWMISWWRRINQQGN